MALLRTCYTTTARAYQGGPLVRIRWYWAKPGAPFYPLGHCWEPALYLEDKFALPDVVGEIPGATRNYYNGKLPKGQHDTGVWCGTEADFLGVGTPPLLPSGRVDFSKLCGCGYHAKIGFRIKSGFRIRLTKQATAGLAFNAAGAVGLSTSTTRAGSLAFAAYAVIEVAHATTTAGSLAFDATAGVRLGFNGAIVGSLALAGIGGAAASDSTTTAGSLALAGIGGAGRVTPAEETGQLAFNAGTTPPYLFLDLFSDTTGTAATVHNPDIGGLWTNAAGTWWIQPDGLEPHTDNDGDMLVNNATVADYTIEAFVTTSWSGVLVTERPGLLVRFSTPSDFYFADVDADESKLRFFKVQGGGFTLLGQGPIFAPSGPEMPLKVICTGDRIQCYWNNSLVTDVSGCTMNPASTLFAVRLGKAGVPPGKMSVRRIQVSS